VELGLAEQILHQPKNEYTRELLAAVPALPPV
jgi:ABC-type dipeptide/oligopeptide/nickel transport system ATPase component